MTPTLIYSVTGMALFGLGMCGLFCSADLFRKVLAVNLSGSGVFLMIVALSHGGPGQAADPVPQALVLTGIVVAVSATAVALALLRRMRALDGAPCEAPGPHDGSSPDRSDGRAFRAHAE